MVVSSLVLALSACTGGGTTASGDRSSDQPIEIPGPSSECAPALSEEPFTFQGFFLVNRSDKPVTIERVRLQADGVELRDAGISEVPAMDDGSFTILGFTLSYPPVEPTNPAAREATENLRRIPGAELPPYDRDRAWGLTLELAGTGPSTAKMSDVELDYRDATGKLWTWAGQSDARIIKRGGAC